MDDREGKREGRTDFDDHSSFGVGFNGDPVRTSEQVARALRRASVGKTEQCGQYMRHPFGDGPECAVYDIDQSNESPSRGCLERAKAKEDWEERQDDGTQEDTGDHEGYDDSQAVFGKRGNKDQEADEKEHKRDLEEGRDGRNERGDLPALPRLESDLADEDVLA